MKTKEFHGILVRPVWLSKMTENMLIKAKSESSFTMVEENFEIGYSETPWNRSNQDVREKEFTYEAFKKKIRTPPPKKKKKFDNIFRTPPKFFQKFSYPQKFFSKIVRTPKNPKIKSLYTKRKTD